jgi:hypothetical protein
VKSQAIVGTAHLDQYQRRHNGIYQVICYQQYTIKIPVPEKFLDKGKRGCIAFRRAQKVKIAPFQLEEESLYVCAINCKQSPSDSK